MGNKKETTSEPYQIRLSENVLRNINEITGFIAFINQQPLNAIKVADSFYEKFERIAEHPFAFKTCEALPTKSNIYRQAICMSWLIIYKVVKTEITILGIIHSSRKPAHIKALRGKK